MELKNINIKFPQVLVKVETEQLKSLLKETFKDQFLDMKSLRNFANSVMVKIWM